MLMSMRICGCGCGSVHVGLCLWMKMWNFVDALMYITRDPFLCAMCGEVHLHTIMLSMLSRFSRTHQPLSWEGAESFQLNLRSSLSGWTKRWRGMGELRWICSLSGWLTFEHGMPSLHRNPRRQETMSPCGNMLGLVG